jgi:N-acetylglutamate synthase-like GNAT family acetyltransferase
VSLRRAEPADASAIRELSRAAYAKWVPVIGGEPLPMTADYNQAVRRHIIDLHEEGGELLALIEMVVETGHLLIENIAVRPDKQGKGIGDRLLRHAEAVAASMNIREIQLYTNAAFVSNIDFYSKRGYQEYDRRTMPSGRTAVFMRKTLPSTQ